jgi:Fe-S-cluster containining protein
MCGNCCSGPAGYVLVTDDEVAALAARLGMDAGAFVKQYTHMTSEGRSLNEKKSAAGLDCVFLDREKIPGKAVCGVYEDRPIQCRTWPFWPSVVKSARTWEQSKRTCPGMDQGRLYPPEQIRIQRDTFSI